MPPSYPPHDLPTFTYVYPAPSTVAEYLRMTSPRERSEPVERPDEDLPLWEGNDFA